MIPGILGDIAKYTIRKQLYKNVKPQGYQNFGVRTVMGLFRPEDDRDTVTPQENAMWAKYLDLGPQDTGGLDWKDYLEETDQRPSKGNVSSSRPYYKIIKGHNPLTDDDYSQLNEGESTTVKGNGAGMGTYTISKGQGFKSYHDIWDINPLRGVNSSLPGMVQKFIPDVDFGKIIGAKEYGIYDRTR